MLDHHCVKTVCVLLAVLAGLLGFVARGARRQSMEVATVCNATSEDRHVARWGGGGDAAVCAVAGSVRAPQAAQQVTPATMVLGLPVCNLDYDAVTKRMAGWVARRDSRYVAVCPVASVIEARSDPAHRRHMLGADLITADGMPLVWAQKLLGHPGATRVYGPTLMLKTLAHAQAEGWRVVLYGGTVEQLEALQRRLMAAMPRLKIVEAISPPFRPLTPDEDAAMVDRLNAAEADVIFVGLGCPRQEHWMADHSGRVGGVMIGVGAAFAFHAGTMPQAPAMLQKVGLEWAFRLACEPKRLFKRYALTNPPYVVLVAWQVFKHKVLGLQYQVQLRK